MSTLEKRAKVILAMRKAGLNPVTKVQYREPYKRVPRLKGIKDGVSTPRTYNRRPIAERIALIRQDVEEGVPSVGLIAQIEGISEAWVKVIAYRAGIDLPTKGYHGEFSPQQKAVIINGAIAKGEKSLESLCRMSGAQPRQFWKLVGTYQIQLPDDLIPWRYRPEMDEVIDRRGTLKEIGIAGGYSEKSRRESRRLYLIHSGQYRQYKKKGEEIKQAAKREAQQMKQIRGNLVNILLQARINELIPTSSWPEQMAVRYVRSVSRVSYAYTKLVSLFERYKRAKTSGKKVSLEKLGKGLGLDRSTISVILHRVGLRPFNPASLIYSKQQKDAARKIYGLKMSSRDIGFFTDMHYASANLFLRTKGLKSPGHRQIVKIGLEYLSYRLASQIYGAQAACFRQHGDIAELLNTSPEIVEYAIDNKHWIAPKIVQALRIAYDNQDYNKPYKMAA